MAKTTTKAKTKRPEREKRDGKDGRALHLGVTIPAEHVRRFKAYQDGQCCPHDATAAVMLLLKGLDAVGAAS